MIETPTKESFVSSRRTCRPEYEWRDSQRDAELKSFRLFKEYF